MAPPKFTPEKNDKGRYITAGLTDKQFAKVFNLIEKAKNKKRRGAKRTLTPHKLKNPSNKALKALGDKVKGAGFTKSDLQEFDKNRESHVKKFKGSVAGITYGEIVSNSRKIDIKRANNQVDDGTGITRATLSSIKANFVYIRVGASMASEDQEHRVKVRFEEWDQLMADPPDNDYLKGTKAACSGRISFDCDCGRHQYWYRYLATMGNYAVTPPKEFSFPKIRNPELKGVACKHVLKAVTMLQSVSWQRLIAKQMESQAKRVGFGDDRKTTHYLTAEEQKQAKRNRNTKVDVSKAKKAHRAYERSQKAMEKKIKQAGNNRDKVKLQAKKIRKQAKELQIMTDMIKAQFSMFADGYKAQGKTRKQAIDDYAKQMNISPNKLKTIVGAK